MGKKHKNGQEVQGIIAMLQRGMVFLDIERVEPEEI